MPWVCESICSVRDSALAAWDVGLEEGIGSGHGLHVAGLQGCQQDIVARRLHIPAEDLQRAPYYLQTTCATLQGPTSAYPDAFENRAHASAAPAKGIRDTPVHRQA